MEVTHSSWHPDNLWIIAALPAEFAALGPWTVLYTGIGKVAAAASLAKALVNQLKAGKALPRLIINVGTAGSSLLHRREVALCTVFRQHDYDLGPLSHLFPSAHVYDLKARLEQLELDLPALTHVCYSGDHFVTYANQFPVVEMEAYALAAIADGLHIPFLALKYISDGTDATSPQEWQGALSESEHALLGAVRQVLGLGENL